MLNDILPSIEEYTSHIKYHAEFLTSIRKPEASVVIVAYNSNWDLIQCLESLQKQSIKTFETLVLDNGKNDSIIEELKKFPIRYFRLHKNYLPSAARNVGIGQAKAEIICFLDDDGVAHPEFVKEHISAIRSNALGVRGKIIPKTHQLYNHLALHYDLGENIIPSFVDMEGNCSYLRSILLEVHGFNPEFFGSEGAELSYRIFKKFGHRDRLLYWPSAIIYHDYSNNMKKFVMKTWRTGIMQFNSSKLYPDFNGFIQSFLPFPHVSLPWPEKKVDSIRLLALIRLQKLIYTWVPRVRRLVAES